MGFSVQCNCVWFFCSDLFCGRSEKEGQLVQPDQTCRNKYTYLLPDSVCLLQFGYVCIYTSLVFENRCSWPSKIICLCIDHHWNYGTFRQNEDKVKNLGFCKETKCFFYCYLTKLYQTRKPEFQSEVVGSCSDMTGSQNQVVGSNSDMPGSQYRVVGSNISMSYNPSFIILKCKENPSVLRGH